LYDWNVGLSNAKLFFVRFQSKFVLLHKFALNVSHHIWIKERSKDIKMSFKSRAKILLACSNPVSLLASLNDSPDFSMSTKMNLDNGLMDIYRWCDGTHLGNESYAQTSFEEVLFKYIYHHQLFLLLVKKARSRETGSHTFHSLDFLVKEMQWPLYSREPLMFVKPVFDHISPPFNLQSLACLAMPRSIIYCMKDVSICWVSLHWSRWIWDFYY